MKHSYDPTKLQVFLMCSPAHMPFAMAIHPWFVCNEQGVLTRYEIFHTHNRQVNLGHIHINQLLPWQGLPVFSFTKKLFWPGKILHVFEGESAQNLIDILKNSPENYPHKHYRLLGPNSNTYAQWVLDQPGVAHVTLPWNAFGKGYKQS